MGTWGLLGVTDAATKRTRPEEQTGGAPSIGPHRGNDNDEVKRIPPRFWVFLEDFFFEEHEPNRGRAVIDVIRGAEANRTTSDGGEGDV